MTREEVLSLKQGSIVLCNNVQLRVRKVEGRKTSSTRATLHLILESMNGGMLSYVFPNKCELVKI